MASLSNTTTPTSQLHPPSAIQQSWSLNQIHANASNWSLQGDAQLLTMMQNISLHLQHRFMSTKTRLDNMLLDLDRANLRLENTSNKMLSLKNMQFIEARVREDIDESMNTASSPGGVVLADATPPLSTVMAIRTAVDNGLQMLDRCYEKVTLHLDDDSANEDDEIFRQSSVIFRSRNPHQDRPLPHLIGSKEWTEKWHVGLVDSDDDNDEYDGGTETRPHDGDAPAFEEFSSSEDDSLSMSVSLPSNVHTVSCSENSDSHRSSHLSVADQAANGNDRMFDMFRPGVEPILSTGIETIRPKPPNDLFAESDSDHSDEDLSKRSEQNIVFPEPTSQTLADPQHAKVLSTAPTHSGLQVTRPVDAPAPIFRSQPQPPKPSVTYGLFDDDPPELDEALVAAKRMPTNIFLDDSDDDEVVINEASQQRTVASPMVSARDALVPPKQSNLFDSMDSEPDDYMPDANGCEATVPTTVQPVVKSNISMLFDDSPPDDLFDQLIVKKSTIEPSTVSKKSIFDDDEDLFETAKSNISDKDATVDVRQDQFATVSPPISATNDSFDEKLNRAGVQATATFVDIFGDDPPEDQFTSIFAKFMPTQSIPQKSSDIADENDKVKTVYLPKSKHVDIFGDIFDDQPEDEFSSIFAKPKHPLSLSGQPRNSLFDKDGEIDDLEPELSSSSNPDSKAHMFESVVITETPAPSVESSDKHVDALQKTTSTPEQYANFYTTKETAEDGSKLVEDRRVFVSYLDNDMPPDFDEWGDSCGEFLPTDILAQQPREDSDIIDTISAAIDGPSLTTVASIDAVPHIESKISDKNAYLFDDEQPPVDDFHEISSNLPTRISIHAAFFDTLPPDDNQLDSQSVQSSFSRRTSSVGLFNDRPPIEDDMFDTTVTPSTSVPSKSMSVFDDLPPDDDLFSGKIVSSHLTTEKKLFYEDFADTIIGPPPDIEQKLKNNSEAIESGNIAKTVANTDQPNDTSDLFKTKLSRFSHRISESNESAPEKPKPKKLNTNLMINVAALLPFANRATSASSQPSEQQPCTDSEDVTDKVSDTFNTIRSVVTNVPENSTGLLVGLNKSRAKITIKRRPSTRLGRQTEYRKSMQNESLANEKDDEPVKSIAEMLQSDNDDDDWFTTSASTNAETIASKNYSTSATAVQQNTSNILKKEPFTPSASITSTPETPAKSMFSDDDDDEDIFGGGGAAVAKKQLSKNIPSITIPRQVPTNTAKNAGASLFESDDNDDDLFGPKPIVKHAKAKTLAEVKQRSSLFGDLDGDDDDDLFGASKTQTNINVSAKTLDKHTLSKPTTMLPGSLDPLADLMKNV